MAKFRKKPVVIEATQWFKLGDHPAVVLMTGKNRYADEGVGWIETLEGGNDGAQVVTPGDWIITGVQGEHYPCKPDIFAATYEEADFDAIPMGAYDSTQPVMAALSSLSRDPHATDAQRATAREAHAYISRHDSAGVGGVDEAMTARFIEAFHAAANDDACHTYAENVRIALTAALSATAPGEGK